MWKCDDIETAGRSQLISGVEGVAALWLVGGASSRLGVEGLMALWLEGGASSAQWQCGRGDDIVAGGRSQVMALCFKG